MWCGFRWILPYQFEFVLESQTIKGDSPVEVRRKDTGMSKSSVYWILGVNVGDINFQL